MRWKKYTLYTREEAVDLVSATFAELGIEGIEIEDNAPLSERDTKGMFIDILPELPPDDGTARVSFYLEPGSGEEEMLAMPRSGRTRGTLSVHGSRRGANRGEPHRGQRLDQQLEDLFSSLRGR